MQTIAASAASFQSTSRTTTTASPRRRQQDVKELVVAPGASTFVVAGQCVPLERRAQLSRVLRVLADAHLTNPGEWIDCPNLIRAAWEGERMHTSSAMNRLHVAIATLRKLGLRPVLQSKRGAYRIRSDVRVIVDPSRAQSTPS